MAKPKNPNNVYSLTCRVTNKEVKTNPKQVLDLMNRYGITQSELINSYVSREGRHQIASEALTPAQAVETYGLHLNVAEKLKATVKSAPAVETVAEPQEIVIDTNTVSTVAVDLVTEGESVVA